MRKRAFKKNGVRAMEIEKQGQESGLPLFDKKPIASKSRREAVLPAHRKAVEVLTPVQRAALDRVTEKMRGQKVAILDILAEGGCYTFHGMHEELQRRGYDYPITSVEARLSTLFNVDGLVEPDGPSRPGPYGSDCTYWKISRSGLQRIADANVESL